MAPKTTPPASRRVLEVPTDRRTLRAELDAVMAGERELPALERAVVAARVKRDEAVQRLDGELFLALRAYSERCDSLARRRTAVENGLRGTAPRLVAERGPLLEALRADIWHLKCHSPIGTERDRELVRDWKGKVSAASDVRAEVDAARTRVGHADAAEKLLPVMVDALADVQELQLQVAPQLPGAVREILSNLPDRCACGDAFTFNAAVDAES